MSDYDHYSTPSYNSYDDDRRRDQANNDFFRDQSNRDAIYGGHTFSEVISNSTLARAYGFDTSDDASPSSGTLTVREFVLFLCGFIGPVLLLLIIIEFARYFRAL